MLKRISQGMHIQAPVQNSQAKKEMKAIDRLTILK